MEEDYKLIDKFVYEGRLFYVYCNDKGELRFRYLVKTSNGLQEMPIFYSDLYVLPVKYKEYRKSKMDAPSKSKIK